MASPLFSALLQQAATDNASLVDPAPADKSAPSGVSKGALTTYLAGLGADMGSTAYFQNHPELGMHEQNPLLAHLPVKAQIPVGGAMELTAMLLAKRLLGANHPKVLNTILAAAGGVHGGFAVDNIRKIQDSAAPTPGSVFITRTK